MVARTFPVVLLLLLLLAFPTLGQKYRTGFGQLLDVEIREALAMKSYPVDTSAKAIVLYSRSDAEVLQDRTVRYKHLIRIKIFDKRISETMARLTDRTFYSNRVGFFTVKGFTYNEENGAIVRTKLDDANVHRTRHNKNYDKVTFSMPNVKDGSVVEYEYSEKGVLSFPKWELQYAIPSLFSEVYFENAYLGFRSDVGGKLPIQYEALKSKRVHHWSLANAPAFVAEPMMPSEDFFKSNVQIWTYEKDWDKEVKWLWEVFFDRAIFQQSVLGAPSKHIADSVAEPKDRLRAVYEYVRSHVEWNGESDFFADDFAHILKEKKGTSGDINLMLISMAAKCGIAVNPVLLSTRDNGPPHEDIPSYSQFNYLVCQAIIGRDTLYVDATQPVLPFGYLPLRCVNVRGLSAPKDGAKWITLKSANKQKLSTEANIALSESGELSGTITFIHDGYSAASARSGFREDEDSYFKEMVGHNWQVDSKKYVNTENVNLPFQEHYEVTIPDHATVAGDLIYLNPYVYARETKNPFTSNTRNYPVEFEIPFEETLLCNIVLPPGYAIEELPESKVIAIPGNGARAIFNISATATQIQIMARVQINRTFFDAEEYSLLKEFYARVFAKRGEQIVLKKAS